MLPKYIELELELGRPPLGEILYPPLISIYGDGFSGDTLTLFLVGCQNYVNLRGTTSAPPPRSRELLGGFRRKKTLFDES